MEWLLLLFVVLLVVVVVILKNSSSDEVEKERPVYQQKRSLLTPAERSFYGVLLQAIPSDTVVFSKVRVADILEPIRGLDRSSWQIAFNKIKAKHFDFALCDVKTLAVKMVVELDDSSHQRARTIRRDELLESACKMAELDLKRIKVQRAYRIEDVRTQLFGDAEIEGVSPTAEIQPIDNNETSDIQTFNLHLSPEGFAKVSAELKKVDRRTPQIHLLVGVEGDLKNQVLQIGSAKNGTYNRWMQSINGHKNTFFWSIGESDHYTQKNANDYPNYLLFFAALFNQHTKLFVIDVDQGNMLATKKELIKEYNPIWEQYSNRLKYSENYPTLTGKNKDQAIVNAVAKLGAARRLIFAQRKLGDGVARKLPDVANLGIRSAKQWKE